MDKREYYLIITLTILSLICMFSLSIKSKTKKRLGRYKNLNITIHERTVQQEDVGQPIRTLLVNFQKRLRTRKFFIFKCILRETIDDFFDFRNNKNLEPKVLKYIILPFIFTFFFVRIADSGESSLNVIINVYNTTLYYIFNKLAGEIILWVVILLILAILGNIIVKVIINKYDKIYLTIIVNLAFILILSFTAIMFFGIIIIEFGNYEYTDIFIPLYYTMVIAMIELFSKFLQVESFIKIILSVIVVSLMFISSSKNKYEYSGGYYFYTTNQTVSDKKEKQNLNFNSISKEIDIELQQSADDFYFLSFNDKYNTDNVYSILDKNKDKKYIVVGKDMIKYDKDYYLGEYNPKTKEFKPTATKLKFSTDELILIKKGRNKLHFVRDGSMRMLEIGNHRVRVNYSGAKYYNQ